MTIWSLFLGVLAISIIPMVWLAGRAYFRYRGTRVVTCPETQLPAAVRADGLHIAGSSAIGEPDFRMSDCSNWPERRRCGQACLSQVQAAPAECVVRTMLVEWYQRSPCAICDREIGKIHWVEYKPALLTPDRKMVEWEDVTPETLAQVLATHQRVCWRCHLVNEWRNRFPGFRAEPASNRASP